jgi:protoheme ferro-lyase
MKKLTANRAEELKAQGVTHIVSIVKSVYFTEYVKCAAIDDILANGGTQRQGRRGMTITAVRNNPNVKKYIYWSQI